MSKLKPPSKIRPIDVPVFCISWFGSNGTSIIAYGGGGGSAKTGVDNKMCLLFPHDELVEISTGVEICGAIQVYEDPIAKTVWLLAAIGYEVLRYSINMATLECLAMGKVDVGKDKGLINAIHVHAMGKVFCVGCDEGTVEVFQMADRAQDPWNHLFSCQGHEKAVCAVQFALRSSYIVSSAKDGTARVWKQGGDCVAVLKCDIFDPKAPKPKKPSRRPVRNMVRGCAFGDLEGKVVYTVASSQRGTAFLSRWLQQPDLSYKVDVRTPISKFPISSFRLSEDAELAALGSTNGDILLVDVRAWKVVKMFPEVHDFPVSAICARPFQRPLEGDGEVPYHAISCSADSKMGLLTQQTKVPKKRKAAGEIAASKPTSFLMVWVYLIVMVTVYNVVQEFVQLCGNDLSVGCLRDVVLLAPSTRPGVLVAPH